MKKSIILIVMLLSVAALLAGAALCQDDLEYLDNEAFEDPRRPAVPFSHDTHNQTAELDDCAQCHHVYDEDGQKIEDESSEDQACADCHGLDDDEQKPGLMKAYHLNCKTCHISSRKGPVACGQCHPK
ncbi:MAG: cytochrome c3 family protein [Desulfobacteraceae bacterium]|nr:cytochrome c3 family protein [Desulfobacteraceae bacterium]